MKNSPESSALSRKRSQPTKRSTLLASNQLSKSEIVLLQQSKKSIADFVQKELPERLKKHHLEHLLIKT